MIIFRRQYRGGLACPYCGRVSPGAVSQLAGDLYLCQYCARVAVHGGYGVELHQASEAEAEQAFDNPTLCRLVKTLQDALARNP